MKVSTKFPFKCFPTKINIKDSPRILFAFSFFTLAIFLLFWNLNFFNTIVHQGFWISSLLEGSNSEWKNFYDWLIIIGLLLFVFFILRYSLNEARKQKIHDPFSWLRYSFWGSFSGIALFVFIYFYFFLDTELNYLESNRAFYLLLIITISFLLCAIILLLIPPIRLTKNRWQFASDSAGLNEDRLGFKDSAKNTSLAINELDNYVSVVGIFGGMGWGKSSYARMIIESLDVHKTLYTYLSLTETNQKKDFSKLFAERWFKTLDERYPRIPVSSSISLMTSILRENGSNTLSSIIKLFSLYNLSILSSLVKTYDKKSGKKPYYLSNDVSKLFGFIHEIKEDKWIILIDEIERAHFDEIYRLVEVIERFKAEGRFGLPTKIVFMLCISRGDLEKLINQFKLTIPEAYLLNDFFFENPKNLTQAYFLPPVEAGLKERFIKEELQKIRDEFDLNEEKDGINLDKIKIHGMYYAKIGFLDVEKAMNFALDKLFEDNPRFILRCIDDVRLFYNSFREIEGLQVKPDAIVFSDIVLMAYVKLKYPELIEFFIKTIPNFIDRNGHKYFPAHIQDYKLKAEKKSFSFHLEKELNDKFSENEHEDMIQIISIVANQYLDWWDGHGISESSHKLEREKRTSEWYNLYSYLMSVENGLDSPYLTSRTYYKNHKEGLNVVKKLNNEELYKYERFVKNLENVPQKVNLEIAAEIQERFINEILKITPYHLFDTLYDSMVGSFAFQVLESIEKDIQGASSNIDKIYKLFIEFLESPNMSTGAKFRLINIFANKARSPGDNRFKNAFERIMAKDLVQVKEVIKNVFLEADERYFNVSATKDIFKNEENFFYIIYQNWDGRLKDLPQLSGNLEKKLEMNKEAIELYWERFPNNEKEYSFDYLLDRSFMDENFEMGFTLESLLEISKRNPDVMSDKRLAEKIAFWEDVASSKEKMEIYKNKANPKDTDEPLRAALIKQGILKDDKKIADSNLADASQSAPEAFPHLPKDKS